MRFGEVEVGQAEGAILAHSVALGKNRLRKGLVLESAHIEALKEAGIERIAVARLEADDLHEDEAALTVAQALIGGKAEGLRLSRPGTGRVNVLAQAPGVVMLDAERLHQMNRVNPMITVATVPPFQQMEAGGMVATIKIISYGVSGADIGKAVGLGRGTIALQQPIMKRACLIVTEIPNGAGDKGRDAIEARLNALGVEMAQVICVPHDTGALQDVLGQVAQDSGVDLILILTGSATSDLNDLAPEALRRAGGKVKRFGMPVDPGNLLFLGKLNKTPVIGLPGCARSPALNGADWVMSRVICGVNVSNKDIAGMGVGGLLKEIPTRPMPRRGKRA